MRVCVYVRARVSYSNTFDRYQKKEEKRKEEMFANGSDRQKYDQVIKHNGQPRFSHEIYVRIFTQGNVLFTVMSLDVW